MAKLFVLGAGLTGLVMANELKANFDEVVVFERQNCVGGLCQTHEIEGINHEFGPHIVYWKNQAQEAFWKEHFKNIPLRDYFVRLSIDGTLKDRSLFDFPISRSNLDRIGGPVIHKTGNESNFEDFIINQIGVKAYQSFVKGYNLKQWGISPKAMSSEWATFRPLNIKEESPPKMFGDLPAGHPVDFRPMFESLSRGLTIHKMFDIYGIEVRGSKVKAITYLGDTANGQILNTQEVGPDDLVISTVPLDTFFMHKLSWRGILKAYVPLLGVKKVMPSYSTTFPNNYPWTRVVEYPQQSGQNVGNKTLLSFAMPFGDFDEFAKSFRDNMDCVRFFISKELGIKIETPVHYDIQECVYPVSTKANIEQANLMLKQMSYLQNMYTCGRLGMYAYVSMSRAVEMAWELSRHIKRQGLFNINHDSTYELYMEQRRQLW